MIHDSPSANVRVEIAAHENPAGTGLFYLLANFFDTLLLPFLRGIKNILQFLREYLDTPQLVVVKIVQNCEGRLFENTGNLIPNPSPACNYLTTVTKLPLGLSSG